MLLLLIHGGWGSPQGALQQNVILVMKIFINICPHFVTYNIW